jgi:hypothetical protein
MKIVYGFEPSAVIGRLIVKSSCPALCRAPTSPQPAIKTQMAGTSPAKTIKTREIQALAYFLVWDEWATSTAKWPRRRDGVRHRK